MKYLRIITNVLTIGLAVMTSAPALTGQHKGLSEYAPVLQSVLEQALPIDAKSGLHTQEIKNGVYVISDGIWQSAFVVTKKGIVVIDAPESYGSKLRAAIAEVSNQPIKVLIYTHAHKDHIGGSSAFADIKGLDIIAIDGVKHFLEEKQDKARLIPTSTFSKKKIVKLGGKEIQLINTRNYHSDEGDILVYIPSAKFLMAIDTLAPGYVPFSGFDLTSNFHEYLKVFDDILAYDFDTFVGGHLTALGNRKDVEISKSFALDVYETTKRIHDNTDMIAVMSEAAKEIGSWDNKYLLFKAFLDKVTADASAEIQSRWKDKLAGVDVWTDSHVQTALVYVRWDD